MDQFPQKLNTYFHNYFIIKSEAHDTLLDLSYKADVEDLGILAEEIYIKE